MSIPVRFLERPSDEAVALYKYRLEDLIEALQARIDIDLYDKPVDIHSTLDGEEIETVRHWIKDVRITTPEISALSVDLVEDGITDNQDRLWLEASYIQSQLYFHMKKNPGHPEAGDAYWELWNKR